jgi:hypothetical protein
MVTRRAATHDRTRAGLLRVLLPAIAISAVACGAQRADDAAAAASGSGGGGASDTQSATGAGATGAGANGTGANGTGGAGGSTSSTGSSSSAGSGGAPPIDCAPFQMTSGTRLRARYQIADGGACVALGFHDLEVGTSCTFQTDENGDFRCFGGMQLAGFADADCTEPLFADVDGEGASYGVFAPPPTACWANVDGAMFAALRLAIYDVVPANPPTVYQRYGGVLDNPCVAGGPPWFPTYAAGAERSPDQFVKGTAHLAAVDAATDVVVVDGEDGSSSMLDAVIDHARLQGCSPVGRGQGGQGAWCPLTSDAGTGLLVYADAACSVTVGVQMAACGDEPVPLAIGEPFTHDLFAVGAELDVSEVYIETDGGCALLADVSPDAGLSWRFYALGAPLPDDTFITIPARRGGTGRVQTEGIGSSTAWVLSPSFGYDTAIPDTSGTCECDLRSAADGTTRCVPGCFDEAKYFENPGCTKPLASGAHDALPYVYLQAPAGQTFHEATTAYSGPVFELDQDTSYVCVELSGAPPKKLFSTTPAPDAVVRVYTLEE